MSKVPTSDNSKLPKKRRKIPKTLSVDQNITLDEIREKFPNLYSELTEKNMSIGIDKVEKDLITSTLREDDKQDQGPFSRYDPDVFDFLSRAKTDKEGLKVIDFLKKQNQISLNTAKELKDKITTEGIRSFGPLRSVNYYYRKAADISSKKTIRKRYPSLKDDQT
jgi:hypothetical protein